ncbi:hypothetical protein EV175_002730 [Coemansia sp. RSA 1933]|nr:hypothetical protein EV175_002730 [Coemansia sp. RSA 1933]
MNLLLNSKAGLVVLARQQLLVAIATTVAVAGRSPVKRYASTLSWAPTDMRQTNRATRRSYSTDSFTLKIGSVQCTKSSGVAYTTDEDGRLPEFTEDQANTLRDSAFKALAECSQQGNLLRAYHIVKALKSRYALRSKSGKRTDRVFHDRMVTLALVQVIRSGHIWEECLPCLNLILEVHKNTVGQISIDSYDTVGVVGVDVLVSVVEAILSPHFALMPSRNLAGLTAQQIIADYSTMVNMTKHLSLVIRATGFSSDIQNLLQLVEMLPMDLLTQADQFELILAYARCQRPATALELMRKMYDLSTEQKIELHAAMCVSLAETANVRDAIEHYKNLSSDSQLWEGQSPADSAFDRIVTPLLTALAMCYSSALCMLPRLPFTENIHSTASSHYRAPASQEYASIVLGFHNQTTAALQEQCSEAQWEKYGVSRSVFFADCMLNAANQSLTSSVDSTDNLDKLAKRLRALQNDIVKCDHVGSSDRHMYGPMQTAQLPALVSGLVRHYLWAAVFSPCTSSHIRKIVQAELEHVQSLFPDYIPSVADLEPALVAFLPETLRSLEHQGNFVQNSAFMLTDSVLSMPRMSDTDPYVARLLVMSRRAWSLESTDHRLYPLYIWLLVLKGQTPQTQGILDYAMRSSPVKIKPGTLALVKIHDQMFFERILTMASTYRRGSDYAISRLRSMIQNRGSATTMTERMATAILYCCERSRSFPAAIDTINTLDAKDRDLATPRIKELFMRVCFVSGQITRGMSLFHHLNYDAKGTQVGSPSFAQIVNYMGCTRGSVVGAEHAFGAWTQIAPYSSGITQEVVDKWNETGMTRMAQTTPNAFMPQNESVSKVMNRLRLSRIEDNATAPGLFISQWEFEMVMMLVSAYVGTGEYDKARPWEKWLLDAVGSGTLRLQPEHAGTLESVQKLHMVRGSWEGMQACLEYMVAMNANISGGILGQLVYFRYQRNIIFELARRIRDDKSGDLVDKIRSCLEQDKEGRLIAAITKVVHDDKSTYNASVFLKDWLLDPQDPLQEE